MRFYPPENMELDKISDKRYLKSLLESFIGTLNLVTRFDIASARIYHTFLKADKADIKNGIFRVWKRSDIVKLYDALCSKNKCSPGVYEKIDLLDKVFNRGGKLYGELSDASSDKAFDNMMENARKFFKENNFMMASYFAKGALMYKSSREASWIINKCRDKANHQKAA